MIILVILLSVIVGVWSVMDYTCISSSSTSPGVSLPRGDIFLLKGTEQTLHCHLNPEHEYYVRDGLRAKDLYFWTPGGGELESVVVDSTTIKSVYKAAEAGVKDVTCLVRNGTKGGVGICKQRLFSGFLPLNLDNFTCVSENWHNLKCSWEEPYNPVTTKYDLSFIEPGKFSHPKKCPNIYEYSHLADNDIPEQTCYIDLKTSPPYRQTVHTFVFYINSTNSLKPGGTIYPIPVDHFSIVKAGPAVDEDLETVSRNQLKLTYSVPDEMKAFDPGLVQDVRLRNEWFSKWIKVNTSAYSLHDDAFTFLLKNLRYAYTNYTVEIKMISATADPEARPDLWSDIVTVSARTSPSQPSRSPEVNIGSFEVVETGTLRTVYAYWKLMKPQEFNGPEFNYIARLGSRGAFSKVVPTRSYARFDNSSLAELRVQLTAENSLGSAVGFSTIAIPQAAFLVDLEPKAVTKIWKGTGRYEVAWRHPDRSDVVTSYTLFWCRSSNQKERPYQCDGELDWKTLEVASARVQTHDLLLPTKDVYQIAVSANADNLSSGMFWSTCTVIEDRLVSRVTKIELMHPSSTSLWVGWKLDCSDQAGIVYGYRIEFCSMFGCESRDVSPDHDKFNIKGLTPYTDYKVGVRIQDKGEDSYGDLGRQVEARTLPDRPGSPPTQLAASNILAGSAHLSWKPPKVPNGEIGEYHVQYAFYDASGRRVGSPVLRTNKTESNLQNLLSYTRYEVNVTGCSVLADGTYGCSHHVATEGFITKVGDPAQPPPPTVQFINSTLVKLSWSKLFQIGAPSVLKWEWKVRRSGENWSPDNPAAVSGDQDSIRVHLDEVNSVPGWLPDCENETNTNMFEFAVRVIVRDEADKEYTGPWSNVMKKAAYCRQPSGLLWISITCIAVVVATIVSMFVCFRCYQYWYKTKDFFGQVGKELETKFVLASAADNLDAEGSPGPEFEMNHIGKSPPKGDNGDNAGDDTDTLLLEEPSQEHKSHRQKSASESATSDLTCHSQGGKSSGTDRTSECSGRSTAPVATDLSSTCSGYVSMCRLDSGGSSANYTQFMANPVRHGTPNTLPPISIELTDPALVTLPTPPQYSMARPASSSSPSSVYLARPPSRPGSNQHTPPLDPMMEEPSLCESNTNPGYSLVTPAALFNQYNPAAANLPISVAAYSQTASVHPLALQGSLTNSSPPSLGYENSQQAPRVTFSPTSTPAAPLLQSTFSNPYDGFLSGASRDPTNRPSSTAASIDQRPGSAASIDRPPPVTVPHHLSGRPNMNGYISVQQAQELVLQPNPNSQQYSRVAPRLDQSKPSEPGPGGGAGSYISPSFV